MNSGGLGKRTFKSRVNQARNCVYYLKERVEKNAPKSFSSTFPCLMNECGLKHSCRENCIFCCSSQCLSVWDFFCMIRTLHHLHISVAHDITSQLSGSKADMNLLCLLLAGGNCIFSLFEAECTSCKVSERMREGCKCPVQMCPLLCGDVQVQRVLLLLGCACS